jgi:hypothetical protein
MTTSARKQAAASNRVFLLVLVLVSTPRPACSGAGGRPQSASSSSLLSSAPAASGRSSSDEAPARSPPFATVRALSLAWFSINVGPRHAAGGQLRGPRGDGAWERAAGSESLEGRVTFVGSQHDNT